ncbi:MAG: hypothetical protein Q7S21_00790 [archaeon]|nr:hypothetical protein [archaeon]
MRKHVVIYMQKINSAKLKYLFKKLTDKELDMRDYINRLMLQKIVFLLQSSGISFGYNFTWYLKGPYCSQLTKDAFAVTTETVNNVEFEKNEEEKILRLKKHFTNELKNDKELELLGSLVFIRNNMQIKSESEIKEKLVALKPWYSKEIKLIDRLAKKIEDSKLFQNS